MKRPADPSPSPRLVIQYSAAGIPLETQWLDIDYMYRRWIMTLDPDRFELAKVRYFIETLKARGQHMIMMVSLCVEVQVDRWASGLM
jgi:alpha-glucosidase